MSGKRRSQKHLKNDSEESDQDFQHAYDPNSQSFKQLPFDPSRTPVMPASLSSSLPRNQETRTRITRNAKANYVEEDKPDALPEHMEIEEQVIIYDFLSPKVECLLWKTDPSEQVEEKFLVKFLGRSYLQTKWMTKKELSEIGFEVTSNVIKSTKTKMRKTIDLKIKQQNVYFNPNYQIADRILTSTEIFTAIHHKRANDIKGKWDESIMLVCEKVLNFVKNGYPYGILLHEPYDEELQKAKGIMNRINIGQVLNKIYLGFYKNQSLFWTEIGIAINNYLTIYTEDKGDYHIVGLTVRQCLIFLYEQWHELCKQRYDSIKKEMVQKGLIPQPMQIEEKQINEKELHKSPERDTSTQYQQTERINIKANYCSNNIFLTEKVVDSPQNQSDLNLLNPNKLSFQWLARSPQEAASIPNQNFKYINQSDFKALDLNAEVDKLYYVKWKDLSYKDATWESEKNINAPEKIQEFKLWNKIPVRQIREKVEIHNKIHKFLMEFYQITSEKKGNVNQNVSKMESKLYLLDAGQSKQPKQYGGKDIPIYKNHRMLKDFQLESLNWLIKSWYENRNTILADEMGLGKTIQTIAFIFHLHAHENIIGPFLILAPLTTLHQWRKEIEQWTTFNCLLYYDEGSSEVRQIIQEYEFYHMHTTKTGDIIPSKIPKFQILLTNYELFINDFEILKKIPYQHIILDEAHRLKNKNTKTTMTLNKLPCCRKTLLTGTPIQNNTKQLWTLLNFIEPKQFHSEEAFLQEYGNLSTEQQVKNFKKMLKPYILRRVKEDVQSTIPKLSQTIIDVQMSANQKTYYRGIFEKNKTMLKSLATANFNSISTQLRKCCNHPYLVSAEIEAEIRGHVTTEWEDMEKFIKSSGKMILLMKLLEKFKKQNKKVLIFSQFVVMLDLMKPYLELSGYNCQILKGNLSSTQRHQAITRFNHQRTDIFLISTKAGGVGINLVAATEIIIYDSDWNPQNDIQATARAHRIGQKNEVTVYRLITANSYQSEMFQLSSKKLGLDKAIFTGDTFKSMGEFDQAEKQLTKVEIQTLLKKGIVGFLENNGAEQDFFNQSIEDILSKKARKVEYAITQNSCTFSKTKFKSEETNDINIDAPDFWEQALKGIETPVDKLIKKRKQLKEYSTIEKQQELMLETYRIVLNFVKQKTLGTGFNAEDERNLLRFLEFINSERHFNRQFRDIADQLSIQIIKPSRRFKIKQQDILIANNQSEQKKQQIPSLQKRESSRLKRLKKNKDENYGIDMQAEKQDQISDVSEEKQESPSPQEQDKNNEQQKGSQDYERLCTQCQRPKCTIFCKGICGRSFHKRCFEEHNKQIDVKLDSIDLEQLILSYDQWKEKLTHELKCVNCKSKSYLFKCSICLGSGVYTQEEASANSRKKKAIKQKKQNQQEDQSTLYKCSAASKCNKFYHLKCLFSDEFCGKFSDQSGKTVKDISNITKTFRCPSHYCNVCYGIDSKSTKLKTYCCIRCCRSYHDKCQDKEKFIRLGSDHYYICASHLKQNQSVERIIDQIKKFKPNKKDKIQIKKKTKDSKQQKKSKDKQPQTTQTKVQQAVKLQKVQQKIEQSSKLRRSKRFKKEQQEQSQLPSNQNVKQEMKQQSKQQEQHIEHEKDHQEAKKELDNSKSSKKSKKSKSKSKEQRDKSKSKDEKSKSKQANERQKMQEEENEQQNIKEDEEKQKEKKQLKLKKELQLLSSTNRTKSKTKAEIAESIFATFKYQYSDFNLTPIETFNFSEYKYGWCRFCGTRYAKSFELGPWGANKLCGHHYEQFKKGKLKLDKYKNEPKAPINKLKENELRFLNDFVKAEKITPEEAIARLNKQLAIH